MATNYRRMNTPDLISKRSDKRRAEAEYRLAEWDMGAKNVRRLTDYVESFDDGSTTSPAPEVTKAAKKVSAEQQLKLDAKTAFAVIHFDSPEGEKMKRARKVYGQILRGEVTVDDILADATDEAKASLK